MIICVVLGCACLYERSSKKEGLIMVSY